MLKNSIKVTAGMAMVIAILAILFLSGNPNPPPQPRDISNGLLKISTYETQSAVELYHVKKRFVTSDVTKLLTNIESGTRLRYQGTTKRLYHATEGWFSDNDTRKVEIEKDQDREIMTISWSNPEKDPQLISYVFELAKDSGELSLSVTAEVKEPDKVEFVGYGFTYVPEYDILTPMGEYLENDGEATYDIYPRADIPPPEKQIQSFIDRTNNLLLDVNTSSADRITDSFQYQGSLLYVGQHEEKDGLVLFTPLKVSLQENVPLPEASIQPKLRLMNSEDANDTNIILMDGAHSKLATYCGWETQLSYNMTTKRVVVPPDKAELGWFTTDDTKKVDIKTVGNTYIVRVSWQNEAKDPSEIGYLFEWDKGSPVIEASLFMEVQNPNLLGNCIYGLFYSNLGWDTIYSPEGRVLLNDKKTNNMIDYGNEIPKFNTGYQLFYNNTNQRGLKVLLPQSITKVGNWFQYQVTQLYVGSPEQQDSYMVYPKIVLELEEPASLPEASIQPKLKLTTSENASDTNIILLDETGSKILNFSGWDTQVTYNKTTKRLVVLTGKAELGWFTTNETKKIDIKTVGNTYIVRVSWQNEAKDPTEIGYFFQWDKGSPVMEASLFVKFKNPSLVGDCAYGLSYSKLGWDTVYTPEGTVLPNDGKTNDIIDYSGKIPKVNTGYQLFYNNTNQRGLKILLPQSITKVGNWFQYQVTRFDVSRLEPLDDYNMVYPKIVLELEEQVSLPVQ